MSRPDLQDVLVNNSLLVPEWVLVQTCVLHGSTVQRGLVHALVVILGVVTRRIDPTQCAIQILSGLLPLAWTYCPMDSTAHEPDFFPIHTGSRLFICLKLADMFKVCFCVQAALVFTTFFVFTCSVGTAVRA